MQVFVSSNGGQYLGQSKNTNRTIQISGCIGLGSLGTETPVCGFSLISPVGLGRRILSHQDVALIETNHAHGAVANEYFRADAMRRATPRKRGRIHEGMVGDAIGTTKRTIAINPRTNREPSEADRLHVSALRFNEAKASHEKNAQEQPLDNPNPFRDRLT